MSDNNGVIKVGRKGIKKFQFGEDGPVFNVDVVVAFQQWMIIDDNFRPIEENKEGNRPIPLAEMPAFHEAAREYVKGLQGPKGVEITVAEALDFLARLREQFNELADFFRPRSPKEPESPDTSVPQSEVRFSVEEAK